MNNKKRNWIYDWILTKISEPKVYSEFESVPGVVHKVSLLYLEGAGGCKSVIHCVDVF